VRDERKDSLEGEERVGVDEHSPTGKGKTMKKLVIVALLSVAIVVFLGSVTAVSAGPAPGGSQRTDFALFDGTNPANQPDSGAVCGSRGTYTYFVAVSNFGAAGVARITYADGDIVNYQIPAGGSFSFSQAAGSTAEKTNPAADRAVRLSNGGSAAQLAGSMSVIAGAEAQAFCQSCDAVSEGGIGDAGCDAIVPN
jgi:hypothetical protein